MLPVMRTGLLEEDSSGAWDTTLDTTVSLLRLFSKDSLAVAGRYACGCGRTVITEEDMCRALKYCARTFFSQCEDTLGKRTADEIALMMQEEEEEGEEEGEGEGEEEEGEGEGEEEGEEEEEGEFIPLEERDPKDVALVRQVDVIHETWALWHPEDPILITLKNAIDRAER